jgi:hypothetical protein
MVSSAGEKPMIEVDIGRTVQDRVEEELVDALPPFKVSLPSRRQVVIAGTASSASLPAPPINVSPPPRPLRLLAASLP